MAPYEELHFDPFSPLTKKVVATVLVKETGESFMVAKGAPEIMNSLPGIDDEVEEKAAAIVEDKAARAFKVRTFYCICVLYGVVRCYLCTPSYHIYPPIPPYIPYIPYSPYISSFFSYRLSPYANPPMKASPG